MPELVLYASQSQIKSVPLGEGLIDPLLEVKLKKKTPQKTTSSEGLNSVTETLNCNSHSQLGVKISKQFQEKFPCSTFSKTGICHFSVKFFRVNAKVTLIVFSQFTETFLL